MTPDDVHNTRFHKAPFGTRGYDEEQVDNLLDRIEGSLRGQRHLTSDDLASAEFGKPPLGKRGYHKDDVDAFVQRAISEWPTTSTAD